MNKHICFFYLGDKLSVEQQQLFYYRICKALKYSEKEILSYYSIYSLQYKLFDKKPMDAGQLEEWKKKKNINSKTCHQACQSRTYKPYNIESFACISCVLSPLYQNDRERIEDTVLRRFMDPTQNTTSHLFQSDKAFVSVKRMSADYAIGSHAVIPFNQLLYDFLKESKEKEPDLLYNKFSTYVLTYMSSGSNPTCCAINEELIRERIKIHLASLYEIELDSINDDMFRNDMDLLNEDYKYTPPLPVKQSSTARKLGHTKDTTQLDIFSVLEHTQDDTMINMAATLDDPNSSIADTESVSTPTPPIIIEEPTDIIVTSSIIEETVSNSLELPHDSPIKEDVSPKATHTITNCLLQYTKATLPKEVIPMSSSNSLAFSSELLRSDYIAFYPVLHYNREALLIYTPHSDTTYLYETEVYGFKLLESLCLTHDIKILTFHSIECMYILRDSKLTNIVGLDLLLCMQHNLDNRDDLAHLLPIHRIPTPTDMNVYYLLFSSLASAHYMKHMRRMIKIYSVLARSFCLDHITYGLGPAFTYTNLFSFDFSFSPNDIDNVHLNGSMFFLLLPSDVRIKDIKPNSLIADVILILSMLPHLHSKRVFLLSIKNNVICLFYAGEEQDSLLFYDIFTTGVQRAYFKRYKKPLKSSSYYMVFY